MGTNAYDFVCGSKKWFRCWYCVDNILKLHEFAFVVSKIPASCSIDFEKPFEETCLRGSKRIIQSTPARFTEKNINRPWRSVLFHRLDLSSNRFFWRAGQPNESFSRLKRKYKGRKGGNRSFIRSLTFVLTTGFAHQFSTCPFVVFFQRKRNERGTRKICKKFLGRRIRYSGEVTHLTVSIRIFSDLIQDIFIIKYVYKLALNQWILKI